MGKKKIIKQTTEQAIKESQVLESALTKEAAKSVSKKFESGRVYINASYNNTLISVTDDGGNLITWSSAGSLGFSGPKKATPFASSKVVAAIAEKLRKSGPFKVRVFINGVGNGRDAALRSLASQGFDILGIKDVTPIPHNGPRPAKVRRV
jgi:small subunit ribosomal protein S11